MMGSDRILLSIMTSHYVIDQSMISICVMQKLLGGEAKNNPRDSTKNFTVKFII